MMQPADRGQLVRELRIGKGLTQEVLGNNTGLSTRSIQRIESGVVIPRSHTLHKIASALDVSYQDLDQHFLSENISQKTIKATSSRMFIFLLGLLTYLIFSMFSGAMNTMYPVGHMSSVGFFYGLFFLSIIIGLFVPLPSLRSRLIKFGTLALLLLSALTIYFGLHYSYDAKTDEYLFYFLLVMMTTLVFSTGLFSIIRFLMTKKETALRELFYFLIPWPASLILGISLYRFSIDVALPVIYYWYFIVGLLMVLLILVFRRMPHS